MGNNPLPQHHLPGALGGGSFILEQHPLGYWEQLTSPCFNLLLISEAKLLSLEFPERALAACSLLFACPYPAFIITYSSATQSQFNLPADHIT